MWLGIVRTCAVVVVGQLKCINIWPAVFYCARGGISGRGLVLNLFGVRVGVEHAEVKMSITGEVVLLMLVCSLGWTVLLRLNW